MYAYFTVLLLLLVNSRVVKKLVASLLLARYLCLNIVLTLLFK
jgi:hypothetical protein